jgi:hypothetical protein
MGSFIELNDTLQITEANGFPSSLLNLEDHQMSPITIDRVRGIVFEFKNKPSARIFQIDPVRVFFVQNINGKWLFWGHAYIQSQTIRKQLNLDGSWDGKSWLTDGTYLINSIYTPDYQKIVTINESPSGLSYF